MPSRIARRPCPTRNGPPRAPGRARPRPARALADRAGARARAAARPRASRSATITPVRPSSTTVAMPPAGVLTSGVPDASASSTVFGRPSTLPLSSRTDGATADVGRGEPAGDLVLRQVAEEVDAIGDAARHGARAQLFARDRRRRRSRDAPARALSIIGDRRRSGTRTPSSSPAVPRRTATGRPAGCRGARAPPRARRARA